MMTTALLIITTCAVALAAGSTALAWRLLREQQRREAARIAALSADIHGVPLPATPSTGWNVAPALMTVGALVAATLALMLPDGGSPSAGNPTPARPGVTSAVQPTPASNAALELVQLSDAGAGESLTVSGRVRNPDHAPLRSGLSAVVMLVNERGDVVARGRSTLDPLEPGGTSTFTVTVASGTVAARYRVSFQAGPAVVPHVDRRPHTPTTRVTATTTRHPTRGLS